MDIQKHHDVLSIPLYALKRLNSYVILSWSQFEPGQRNQKIIRREAYQSAARAYFIKDRLGLIGVNEVHT